MRRTKRTSGALFALFALLAAPSEAAVAFQADGGYAGSASAVNNVSVPIPNGSISNGQLMVMLSCTYAAATTTITTPSGWTYFTDQTWSGGSNGVNNHCYVFYKFAASEGTSITVTVGSGAINANEGIFGAIRVFKNTAASSPLGLFSTKHGASGTGTGQTITLPAVGETFRSGELEFLMEISQSGNQTTSWAPTAGDLYFNAGSVEQGINLGDLNPAATSSAEVGSLFASVANALDENGIALIILPPVVAPSGGLTTRGVGS